MLGNYETNELGTVGYPLVYLIFSLAAIFLIVIMLNLLIAIISNAFERVQE